MKTLKQTRERSLCATCLHPRRSLVDSGMKKNLYSDIRSSWTSSWSNKAECQENTRGNKTRVIFTIMSILMIIMLSGSHCFILLSPSSSFCVMPVSEPGMSMTRGTGQWQVLACWNCFSWSRADSRGTSGSFSSVSMMDVEGRSIISALVPWNSKLSILDMPCSVNGPRRA